MKRIISFLKTDVKIINSYFLLAVIFIILISIGYSSYALFSFTKTSNNVIEGTVGKVPKNLDESGANKPVLASNMIPVYYDETNETWKKADVNNKNSNYQWYSYESSGDKKGMWANIVTIDKGGLVRGNTNEIITNSNGLSLLSVNNYADSTTSSGKIKFNSGNGGTFSFNYNIVSSTSWDYFVVVLNGTTVINKRTTTNGDNKYTVNLNANTSYVVEFKYLKDEDEDCLNPEGHVVISDFVFPSNIKGLEYEPGTNYPMQWTYVTEKDLEYFINAKPGTTIPMKNITTMWVWIPRFNAVTPSDYNGGTKTSPGAIDVTFVKTNETAIDAFTFGTKQLSGFWYGKFGTSHSTLASKDLSTQITGKNSLECTNETCSNANGIIIKPNVKKIIWNRVSNFFYSARSMEQTGNSFGFVSGEVDTHMSKNNEWGAVAYLTQSIYGRCTNSTTCTEVGINNNSGYLTGYGAPAGSNDSATNGAYNTTLGKDASTTGTIYGIYDMSGGAMEYVMGVYNKTISYSGFSNLPDEKYYNNYTDSSYIGHALTEVSGWYDSSSCFVSSGSSWFLRNSLFEFGCGWGTTTSSGYNTYFVITNE